MRAFQIHRRGIDMHCALLQEGAGERSGVVRKMGIMAIAIMSGYGKFHEVIDSEPEIIIN